MRFPVFPAAFALLLFPVVVLRAQTAPLPGEDPAQAELRAVRESLVAGFNGTSTDRDTFLGQLPADFTATGPDAAVSRGPAGVRWFFEGMVNGPIRGIRVDRLEVDRLASLHAGGQVATAVGSLDETFTFKGGRRLTLPCRWTATLTRIEGRWQPATFHASANVFDNPVLLLARVWAAGIAGILAGAVGLWVGFRLGRRSGRGASAIPVN